MLSVVFAGSLISAGPALAETVYALTSANGLEHFDSATPGTVVGPVAIGGLAGGESLVGINIRPADGKLYAVSNQSRLYEVNTATAFATQVGSSGAFTLSGTEFGLDVNPAVDRIRVVSDVGQNLRLNPADGTLTGTDNPLSYSAGDPNQGKTPTRSRRIYEQLRRRVDLASLRDRSAGLDILVTQNRLNNGTLPTVG